MLNAGYCFCERRNIVVYFQAKQGRNMSMIIVEEPAFVLEVNENICRDS